MDKVCESGVDLAFGSSLQDSQLHSLGARSVLAVLHDALGIFIFRVHQQDNRAGLGNQIGKQLKPPVSSVTPVRSLEIVSREALSARDRKFADSPLEGDGFELLVPPGTNPRFERAI